MKRRTEFAFLNAGHFYDHFFMLVFASASALALTREWGMDYADLIVYATPGFVAFGVLTLPAGWLADRWSRRGMLTIFFVGLGFSAVLTSMCESPLSIGLGLFCIGAFASIYHPVGLSLVIEKRERTGMPLAVNGVFGNLGVAGAALITGYLIDNGGWRAAFAWPGMICLATGLAYAGLLKGSVVRRERKKRPPGGGAQSSMTDMDRSLLLRALGVVMITTALGGLIFQSTTFMLPKVLDERMTELGLSAAMVGRYAFIVFALGAAGQLVVGYLVDRFPAKVVFASASALQAVCLALMMGIHGWPALLLAMIFMLGIFGQIPVNDVLIGRIAYGGWRSRIFALRYIVTFSVMAASVPIIAWIKGTWGFDRLFFILAVAATGIFLTVQALPNSVSQKG